MPETIYLDNAATTRVDPRVADLVANCMVENFGNPASAHHLGIAAERLVKNARKQIATALGDPEGRHGQLLFTSGGTESDGLGIVGAARANRGQGRNQIVISAVEHPAVRECAQLLEGEGFRVTRVDVNQAGAVDPAQFAAAVNENTAVASVMLVNNEIGSWLPVADIARAVKQKSKNVHFHCDAVQALGKVPFDVVDLGIDSAALSGHKIHAPKGIGALWLRKGARIAPLWTGGGQQDGLRSGTLNVPGIAALGLATELAMAHLQKNAAAFATYADILKRAVDGTGVEVRENGAGAKRAPHILSLALMKIPAEPLLHVLESRGVLVSAGSACAERDRKPSPVLSAIGLPKEFGTLRVSFSRFTTGEQIEEAADVIASAIQSFR